MMLQKLYALLHLQRKRIFLPPQQTSQYKKVFKFCGIIISGECITFDPRNSDEIGDIEDPQLVNEQHKMFCNTKFNINALPDYDKLV